MQRSSSSLTNDTLALLRTGSYLGAAGNVGLTLVLGFAAVGVGFVVGKST